MFTGIIEGLGKVMSVTRSSGQLTFRVHPEFLIDQYQPGESIALNGVCLTVSHYDHDGFEVYASEETVKRTNLGKLKTGSMINLERALRVGDRVGGHFVSGHVDDVASVRAIKSAGESKIFRVEFNSTYFPLVIEKGAIALDGVSLTVNRCGRNFLEVNVIPETLKRTLISAWRVGYQPNIEFDFLGKYAIRGERNAYL